MTILSEAKSLNDVAGLLGALPQPDKQARAAAAARQMSLTKPPFALGRLEDLAAFMAAWQGTAHPEISKMQALVFAGNHGVCAQGVNPFPQDVTVQMVANFEQGGAAINQLCALAGAELSVIALDLETPTADFTEAAAMTPEETLDAMQRGAAAVDAEASVISLGEMGIGNSTISAALACAGFGGAASEWVGRGTGSDEAGKALKAQVIEAGLARHAGLRGLDMLAALGGREQAALCGAVKDCAKLFSKDCVKEECRSCNVECVACACTKRRRRRIARRTCSEYAMAARRCSASGSSAPKVPP